MECVTEYVTLFTVFDFCVLSSCYYLKHIPELQVQAWKIHHGLDGVSIEKHTLEYHVYKVRLVANKWHIVSFLQFLFLVCVPQKFIIVDFIIVS